jgi:hypothetical protein
VDESLINGFIDPNRAVPASVHVIHFAIEPRSWAPLPGSTVWIHNHSYRRRITQRTMFDRSGRVLAIPFDQLLDEVFSAQVVSPAEVAVQPAPTGPPSDRSDRESSFSYLHNPCLLKQVLTENCFRTITCVETNLKPAADTLLSPLLLANQGRARHDASLSFLARIDRTLAARLQSDRGLTRF